MDTTRLQKLLEEHEGYRRLIYKDTMGIWTAGIGRNMQTKGLSHDEAVYLLINDINECDASLNHFVWYITLDDIRKCVLIELCFNLGLSGLLGFKQTLAYIANENWPGAVKSLCASKWATQISKERLDNICYRLEHGEYPQ